MTKKISILFMMMVVAFGITLVACGQNNNSDMYGYGYGNDYRYNSHDPYGRHGRHGGLRHLPHGQSSCGSGWHTGYHYTEQRGFCFEAGLNFGFQLHPWQGYHGLLCDVTPNGWSSCPRGMYCQPAPGIGHLRQPLGFCTY